MSVQFNHDHQAWPSREQTWVCTESSYDRSRDLPGAPHVEELTTGKRAEQLQERDHEPTSEHRLVGPAGGASRGGGEGPRSKAATSPQLTRVLLEYLWGEKVFDEYNGCPSQRWRGTPTYGSRNERLGVGAVLA